jgi:hypothetical protein
MVDVPMFSLLGPEWTAPSAVGTISHVAISHGSLYVCGSSGKIVRLGVGTGEYEELDLPTAYRSSLVHGLYCDTHSSIAFMAALRPTETIYFFRGKSRQLGKLKGIMVTAVAWLRYEPNRPDVREVLIGSAAGIIYEAAIEPQRTKFFRQLHVLQPAHPITGLQVPTPTPATHRG